MELDEERDRVHLSALDPARDRVLMIEANLSPLDARLRSSGMTDRNEDL